MDLDIKALDGKLNAVLDMPAKDPDHPVSRSASTSSLASTSSEALNYHSMLVHARESLTEEEQARRAEIEHLRQQLLDNDPERRVMREQREREEEAIKTLAMCAWVTCPAYESEASRLTIRRAAEDSSRNISGEGGTPIWAENDQRSLELQRQKEDYLQVARSLSIFLAGDEESECEGVLRYRLRNVKTLLRRYKSQWHKSNSRLRQDAHKRKQRVSQEMSSGGLPPLPIADISSVTLQLSLLVTNK
ncbi:uncharacterized protein BP5553_06282 [Venustampulla echinocandica]|uniref:Uncharacterized protein n=1 Tax=Venustampulla echinocandica TaxID=2656787 RepID=A0A370TJG6_9HELO|nr:uncharacterized protein BP5553_06282 [Venustampulla echinocandica]RDL35670.1 hypothetical protein BP5553_06282 [Venustampulla echinocandica]